MKYTFNIGYEAHTINCRVVTIPDQVAEDQAKYNGKTFPVLRKNGEKVRAMLMGELYGLGESGTGDPVVKMV